MAGETERDRDETTPHQDESRTSAAGSGEPPGSGAEGAEGAEGTAPEKPSAEAKAAAIEKAKAAAAAKAKAAAAAKAKADEGPPRALPSKEDIAAWARGGEANVGILFEGLPLNRFDVFVTKIRNEELVPQHWQVISALHPPEDAEFERLPEVGRLRQHYRDQAVARQRLDALRTAWRELRGKRPSLWEVPDLLAAMRRIIARERAIDWNELLTAVRDLWLTSSLPAGKEQAEILWASLALVRDGTKK